MQFRYANAICLLVAFSALGVLSLVVETTSAADEDPWPLRHPSGVRHPVILVPGYQGSQLEVTLNGNSDQLAHCFARRDKPEVLWMQVSNFNPRYVDCWLDLMRLGYDHHNGTTMSAPGVDIHPRDFGLTSTVEYVSPNSFTPRTNYFGSLVRYLVRRDYRRNVDIRGASYDWRRAPHENTQFMTKFKALIEETMRINDKRPVALVCHSMGCKFAYYFLRQQDQQWKDEFVKALVITATPWDGNFKYLYSYIGRDDDLGATLYPAIRRAEHSFSALAFLLPHKRGFTDNLIETPAKNYSVDNYDQLFHDLGNFEAYEMQQQTSKLFGNFEHPEVNIYCIGGVGVSTMSKLIYDGPLNEEIHLLNKRLHYEDGDGILLAKSMRGCLRWKDTSKTGKRFQYKEFSATHMGVIQDRQPVDHIYRVLRTL